MYSFKISEELREKLKKEQPIYIMQKAQYTYTRVM